MRRIIGLILYWISAISLTQYYGDDSRNIFFDIHQKLIEAFDVIPSLSLLYGLLFFSLYLLFHISYSKILTQFGEGSSYAIRKQVEMMNSLTEK